MIGSNSPRLAFPKPRPRIVESRALKAAKLSQLVELKKRIRKRDGSVCRSCGRFGVEIHHLVYRSHGGKDEAKNVVLLCLRCHQDIHAKLLIVTFNPKHPARTVKFRRYTA